MVLLEIKKSFHNKSFLYLFGMTAVAFIMGWILPVGIDKVAELHYSDYLFSTYTVFTQFGMLFFCFGTAFFFNREYSQKTILFYRSFGYNSTSFLFTKLLIMVIEEFVALTVCLFVSQLVFGESGFSVVSLILFFTVVLQYFLITGIFSMIFSNMLLVVGCSVMYWLATIILVSFGGAFKNFAVFDASNDFYNVIDQYYAGKAVSFTGAEINPVIIEIAALVAAALLVSLLSRKRWLKMGI